MWEKTKGFFVWIYNWITVLTASLVGLPALLLQLLASLDGINLTPLIGADMALKIVTAVALVKALLAFIVSKVSAKA